MRSSKQLDKLIAEALAIEAQEARKAGTLGYMARALVQATMPHKKCENSEFTRHNGNFSLTILAPSEIGLPYGTIPRLLTAWITTEAVKMQQRELALGKSLSSFMEKLGLVPSGGRWGSITRLRHQMQKLFSSSISCNYSDSQRDSGLNIQVAEEYHLWWEPKIPEQACLWESTLILNKRFFNEITKNPVPINMDALKALKRSPMAIDVYCWLTYRMSYLDKICEIPWPLLQTQFGSDYATDLQGTRNFKKAFLRELKKVITIYPANIYEDRDCLILKPSITHIPKIS
jgi:hypothetical protein